MHLQMEIYEIETYKLEDHTRYTMPVHSGPYQMHPKYGQQNALKIYHCIIYHITFKQLLVGSKKGQPIQNTYAV